METLLYDNLKEICSYLDTYSLFKFIQVNKRTLFIGTLLLTERKEDLTNKYFKDLPLLNFMNMISGPMQTGDLHRKILKDHNFIYHLIRFLPNDSNVKKLHKLRSKLPIIHGDFSSLEDMDLISDICKSIRELFSNPIRVNQVFWLICKIPVCSIKCEDKSISDSKEILCQKLICTSRYPFDILHLVDTLKPCKDVYLNFDGFYQGFPALKINYLI